MKESLEKANGVLQRSRSLARAETLHDICSHTADAGSFNEAALLRERRL